METLTVYASLAQGIRVTEKDTYAEAHDASEGTVGTGTYFSVVSSLWLTKYEVYRGYLTFDTSALGAVARISSATLSLRAVCFPDGTLVHTLNGPTAIENIDKGDIVWSWNPLANRLEPKQVSKVIRSSDTQFRVIETQRGILMATLAHPFMVAGKGWIRASALRVGDCLISKGEELVRIAKLATILNKMPVYDLTVRDNNSYFVGSGILVHNKTEADAGQATLHVVQGIHGASLATDDFGDLKAKTTSGGSISHDDWISGWNEITLSATGRKWISKTGTTKLGLRLSGDIDNSTPTGGNVLNIWGVDSETPYLTIVYTKGLGNPNIDQLIYQHAERMGRFR